jgi:glycerate kinase
MNILVAFNSFKQTAESVELNEIAAKELSKIPEIKVISRPLSDGGDGFLEVCKSLFEINPSNLINIKGYSDLINNNNVLFDQNNKRVYIESAKLFGLKLYPEKLKNPLNINSELLGKIIKVLIKQVNNDELDIESVYIGVGGTATIDFGLGACSHLGLELLNKSGEALRPVPQNFLLSKKIQFDRIKFPFEIKFIVDVETELIGNPGAIEIYGKQKGANEKELVKIKHGIMNILKLMEDDLKIVLPSKLNGAGGGLAAGINLLYNSKIISAKDFVKNFILKDLDFDKIDSVITGEGQFDCQSFEGKGTGVIIELFKDRKTPVFLINGSTILPKEISLPQNVQNINLIDLFSSKEESMQKFDLGLKKVINIVVNKLIK